MSNPTYDRETGEFLPAVAEPPQPMRNLIFASPECGEVFGALIEFQGSCEAPKKSKTATVKGRTKGGSEYNYSYAYAPLDEIHNAIRAPMKEAGLAYRQFLALDEGRWMVRTIIAHKSGQWFGSDYPLFWDQDRGMQGFASGATYARRYGLMLALGIVAEDDDDANVADGQPATIAETRSGARTARQAPSGHNGSRQPQQAAPAPSDAAAEATKRWREIAQSIDMTNDPIQLSAIDSWPAFQTLERLSREAASSEEEHQENMDLLRHRARRRREQLAGDAR